MKYTKDEYIRLGRTLQKEVSENLPDGVLKFTTVAIKFCGGKYKSLYEIMECYNVNPYDCDTVIREVHEFHSYDEILDYLHSIGFNIDDLNPAKGLKISF
ncbi:TPA_asm: hypothetical protein GNB46_004634 [Salmonella enterica subsp. enterica serovar Infantis]|uniref:Uncharacterized protein n=1 Tax=Salmonella enterica subsp. enterica serovar Infantis str. CFSAN000522 TaxID=1299258 RepID=A0A5Y7ANY1_SALIN|nr:hypothetical protein [Salmonella enterica subsp. enterica serovar Infantis str. CFSAN000522]HAE6952178.1 hypothetical protein [Salmonella enterica subsp. enterica serovar Infantis]